MILLLLFFIKAGRSHQFDPANRWVSPSLIWAAVGSRWGAVGNEEIREHYEEAEKVV